MSGGDGFGVGQIFDGFSGIVDAQRRRYIFLAVEGFFLLRRARDWFRLFRHAGSIDQISGSDQAESGRQNEECRMKKVRLSLGSTESRPTGGISNWKFQISESARQLFSAPL